MWAFLRGQHEDVDINRSAFPWLKQVVTAQEIEKMLAQIKVLMEQAQHQVFQLARAVSQRMRCCRSSLMDHRYGDPSIPQIERKSHGKTHAQNLSEM